MYLPYLRLLLPQRHHVSHDALLQLWRAAHVRSQPVGLLPVWLPASAGEAAQLSVEDSAAANHGAECPGEVSEGGAKYDAGGRVISPAVVCPPPQSAPPAGSVPPEVSALSFFGSSGASWWRLSVHGVERVGRAVHQLPEALRLLRPTPRTPHQSENLEQNPVSSCSRTDGNALTGCFLCSFLLFFLLFRLVLGLCPITFKLFIDVWTQQEPGCRRFAATSSLTQTVTIITGADISPPGRFISAWTERWSPSWGTQSRLAVLFYTFITAKYAAKSQL